MVMNKVSGRWRPGFPDRIRGLRRLVFGSALIVMVSLVSADVSRAVGRNLIGNPSFEAVNGDIPLHWSKGQWGNLVADFGYPVAGHTGANAARVEVRAFVNGDAKWYFGDVPVNPEKEYVFSDWSNASANTVVTARFRFVNGSERYVWLGTVPWTGKWRKFRTHIAVPIGAVSMTIFHAIGRNGYLVVDDYSLREVGPASRFPRGMVSFTFDDGYRNVYDDALPILDRAGIRSTQSIITGGTFVDPNYITRAQLKVMAARGHEIASHTRTHAALATVSVRRAWDEIAGSKNDLATLGIRTVSFAYPFGSYSDATMSLVKGAGYVGARSSDEGYNTPSSDPYHLLSQNVNNDVQIGTVTGWIDTAIAEKWWLILIFHRQEKSPNNPYGNDPAVLRQIVDYVKAKGVKTVTLGQGISILRK